MSLVSTDVQSLRVSLQLQASEWKPEIRLPSNSEYAVINALQWDTEYDVCVVAQNQKGKSQPATLTFRTSTEPEAIPGTQPQVTVT